MKAGIKKWISCLLMAVLAVSAAAGSITKRQVQAAEKFQIHYINVGAGDGALLQYGEGSSAEYAMIDTGADYYTTTKGEKIETEDWAYNYLKKKGVTKLKFILLTHPHRDHIGGLIRILQDDDIDVEKIYGNNRELKYAGANGDDKEFSKAFYEDTLEAIDAYAERNNKGENFYEVPAMGSTVNVGNARMQFYGPADEASYQFGRKVNLDIREINKRSIVCRITNGSNTFLMTGDAQRQTIDAIVKKGYNLSAQVLKVPHHGMQDVLEENKIGTNYPSDHKYLFDKANASISVVSNGYDNDNESPLPRVLKELAGSDVYLTSNRGTIVVSSDGASLSVSTEKGNNVPSYEGDYNPAKKSSPTMKSISVSSNGKNKLVPTAYSAANSYKLYEKKNITVKFSGVPQPFTKVKSVQYKFVKKGQDNRTVPYRTGSSAAVKNGSVGRIYVKYNTWLGSTVIKLPGFTVDTSAPSGAKIKGSKSGIKTYKTSAKNRYNKKYKKSIKLTFSASYGTSGKSKVQYKIVPKGKKHTKYKWKTGNSVTYKKKKKWVRVYVKFTDKSGNTTTRKTNGFYIKK
ncbi:ComEC/Rec2 family competence protein [Anaerostipes sp.]|uniref:ComEC/Rec2 family competence protein n=1 Tax=Anaerostipes sp. TaxID=1872530 RepID=UPI0025C54C5C|nr:MBL fold metallo-hydrolase [Anaerostipes sp.]MBS7007535.1 MBL fold metallo-hydrolase [Anaerostipes sp.]